jgi:cytochrome c-type biogenesis protein CcmH
MLSRRRFVGAVSAAVAGTVIGPRTLPASTRRQVSQQDTGTTTRRRGSEEATPAVGVRTTMSGPMDTDAYHAVSLPPKAAASASMSVGQRDALEHDLHCQCGCTLDVFTCRTTDFTCSVSPAMHRDVVQLVGGGYSKPEIIGAFRAAYGDRVLMAPVAEGFNWAAYVTPFLALGAGASLVAVLIRRWTATARLANAAAESVTPRADVGAATPSELAQLDAALRDDSR